MVIWKTGSASNKYNRSLSAIPLIITSSGSGYSMVNKPEIEIFNDVPKFKSWPRDCFIVYDARIVLTMNKTKRDEIYKWLNSCNIEWKPIDEHTFQLYDAESITLFKMTWL